MSVKVVVRRFVDPYVVEVSAQQTFGGYGQQDLLVDFGRIVLRTTDRSEEHTSELQSQR